jgi:hypothetical protein
MSDPQAGSSKPADALEQWRELRDTYVDIWAKASGEAVNSEAYAQASGTMLEAFLTTSSPFRDAQKKAMVSALEQCNMPSRDDYVRLADRLANLELLLDDMDARLRQVHQILSKPAAQPAVAAKPAAAPKASAAPEPAPIPEPAAVPHLFAASAPEPAVPHLFAASAPEPAAPHLFAAPAPTAKAGAAKPAAHKTPAKLSKKGSK